MSQRLYKFLSPQYGVDNLQRKQLKVSTIDDLNDPFDLVSVDTTDPDIERALDEHVIHFRKTSGLLCFSRNWDNLLLWSHYGASHTGFCLGFDVLDDHTGGYGMDVRYQPNMLSIRGPEDVNEELVNRLLRTKSEIWSYEQEVRLFVKLDEPADAKGLWWAEFGPGLELKEVIAGSQCSPADLKSLEMVVGQHHSVERSWAYMRKDVFGLVRHAFPPPWFA